MNIEPPPVQLDVKGPIACITFCRPSALNALDQAMAEGFRDAIAEVAGNSHIRVLLLKGAGRAFMAGGDVAALAADPLHNTARIMDPLHQAVLQMSELAIPVVAGLHGAVAGAGMSLALAADLAVAADNLNARGN